VRQLVASVVVLTCCASHAYGSWGLTPPSQAGAKGSDPIAPATGACALLTQEMVTEVTPYEPQALDLVLRVPPMEDALGASGSACSYGGITLQIDPFTPARLEKLRGPAWVPVAGVGEAAYFEDNKGRWAQLYARAGRRVVTIQMDVPTGRTAASIQPNVVALARAILPKLK